MLFLSAITNQSELRSSVASQLILDTGVLVATDEIVASIKPSL